jgi:hypothetical protein
LLGKSRSKSIRLHLQINFRVYMGRIEGHGRATPDGVDIDPVPQQMNGAGMAKAMGPTLFP